MSRGVLTAILLLSSVFASEAQQFERVFRNNFWNDGINAAGMRLDSLKACDAALEADYETGGFRNFSDPEYRWSAGASARAITHFKKTSMYGEFAFRNDEQYNVCGSMMRNPGAFPFDVVETTPGRKTIQSYTIKGSLATDLGDGWVLGLKLDFKSDNSAKKKDLRYSSYLLDFAISPSLLYNFGDFSLGASLLVKRYSETVSADQIGSALTTPKVFFNQGADVGYYQEWTGSNVHLKEAGVSGLPAGNNLYGAGLQFQWKNIYADILGSYSRLTVGEKQIIWYRAGTPGIAANAGARFGKHSVRAHYDASLLTNNKTVMDKVTEGGVTNTVEFGYNTVLKRQDMHASLEYEFLSGNWESRTRGSFVSRRELATPAYPSVYTLASSSFSMGEEIVCHIAGFDLTASVEYSKGWYDRVSRTVGGDPVKIESSGVKLFATASSQFRAFDRILISYDCANRVLVGLKIKYIFANGIYLQAGGNFVYGIAEMEKPYRIATTLRVGYYF